MDIRQWDTLTGGNNSCEFILTAHGNCIN